MAILLFFILYALSPSPLSVHFRSRSQCFTLSPIRSIFPLFFAIRFLSNPPLPSVPIILSPFLNLFSLSHFITNPDPTLSRFSSSILGVSPSVTTFTSLSPPQTLTFPRFSLSHFLPLLQAFSKSSLSNPVFPASSSLSFPLNKVSSLLITCILYMNLHDY